MSWCNVFGVLLAVFSAALAASVPQIKDDTLECDYGYMKQGDWCYIFFTTEAVYATAVQKCRLEGGDLASIHDKDTNTYLATYAEDSLIGLMYLSKDTFTWSDNTTVEYKNLSADFMEYVDYLGDCAYIAKDGFWYNAECEIDAKPYICKKAPTANPNTRCADTPALLLDGGQLTNPGYPRPSYFEYSEWCSWNLAAKNGHLIQIAFDELSLSYEGQLDIYEGFTADDAHLLKEIKRDSQSSVLNKTISTVTSNRMLVKFWSSGENAETWSAFWTSSQKSAIKSQVASHRPLYNRLRPSEKLLHSKLMKEPKTVA